MGLVLMALAESFHDAPASAKKMKNPYAGDATAVAAGKAIYAKRCASCHGSSAQGTGNVPSLVDGPAQTASPGEVFWFITTGSVENGMPAWGSLPEKDRWQVVTYVQSLGAADTKKTSAVRSKPRLVLASAKVPIRQAGSQTATPAATAGSGSAFMDYRAEEPGHTHHITVQDLPEPNATPSANNGPDVVTRPSDAWPKAPSGFKVEQYATGLSEPRVIRTAPNGDLFVAETSAGQIRVFRGISSSGTPQQTEVFASGLKRPYGIAFYPPGKDPQWVYVGSTGSVVRYPYHNGDMKSSGAAQHIVDLPNTGGGHWTRDVQFSADGKKMYVGVGSASNVDDPDTHSAEKDRADILEFNPDGSGQRVYAYGIRNAGGGLMIHPKTGQLWCSVNERDGLGDNLVPDYITHVEPGGFYGWPWWYMGGHQDPRHKGKHPELKDKVLTPDVLLQAHNASLQMTFYDGQQFPAEYRGDMFAAEHGSWNKAIRTGYEVIRVPMTPEGRAKGEFQDFLTGFVVDNKRVWGRPVGVTVAADGSLMVTDDASNSIWRVSYAH
jgi:glucose/arabinose dehydrogenase/mono/diheme cytochrome c family protein